MLVNELEAEMNQGRDEIPVYSAGHQQHQLCSAICLMLQLFFIKLPHGSSWGMMMPLPFKSILKKNLIM